MSNFIHVNGIIQVTSYAPTGVYITDEIKDILDEIKDGIDFGGYALMCGDLGVVRDALEDGEALSALGIDDDYTEAVESLHSALVRHEQETEFEAMQDDLAQLDADQD